MRIWRPSLSSTVSPSSPRTRISPGSPASHGSILSQPRSHDDVAALPVTIEAAAVGRYPQQAEAAVYFSVLEALQNAAKYARASAVRVTLSHDGAALAFTVEDDGTGFPPPFPGASGLGSVTSR
ncbi:MAG TPA: ATP-binding protein [Streptosporangiaceae bacterium]|nr:ATP-binding protein [Streptosporangiaceae bacterium]